MNEIQAVEGMVGVHNSAIHMNAAVLAGMALDDGGGIHDLKLILVRRYAKVVARHDRDLRKQCTFRLPALRAAAHVVVCALPIDRHLDRVLIAMARKRPAGKIGCGGFQTLIHGRVN